MLKPIEIDPKTFLRKHCELPALPEVVLRVQKVLGKSGEIQKAAMTALDYDKTRFTVLIKDLEILKADADVFMSQFV